MTIEFYDTVRTLSKVVIAFKEVDKVSSNKYLGTLIDDKFYCIESTKMVIFKSSEVDKSILIMFYRSFLESVLTFAMICWFYGLNVKSRSQLQHIINVGSKIRGSVQLGLSALCERNVLRKSLTILLSRIHLRQHQTPSLHPLVLVPRTTNHPHLPSSPVFTSHSNHLQYKRLTHSVLHCLVSSSLRLQTPYSLSILRHHLPAKKPFLQSAPVSSSSPVSSFPAISPTPSDPAKR